MREHIRLKSSFSEHKWIACLTFALLPIGSAHSRQANRFAIVLWVKSSSERTTSIWLSSCLRHSQYLSLSETGGRRLYIPTLRSSLPFLDKKSFLFDFHSWVSNFCTRALRIFQILTGLRQFEVSILWVQRCFKST